MNTQEMYDIIVFLNQMEEEFLLIENVNGPIAEYATYKKYLSSDYIVKHNLQRVYWPQVEGKVGIRVPRSLKELPVLDEDILLFSGLNFQISKQINFRSELKHFNNYFECLYILEGQAELDCADKTFILHEGDCFFLPPNVDYLINTLPGSIAIHIVIRRNYIIGQYTQFFMRSPLIIKFFDEAVLDNTTTDYLLLHTGRQEEIRDIVLHTFIEYLYESSYREDAIYSYLSLLFNKIIKHCDSNIDTTISISKFELYFQRIIEYLNKNYRTATLESTAHEVFFTKQYLCRIIKTVSGKNFSNLLAEIRIEKARMFIDETNNTLETIAEYTGFSDSSHLSRTFKSIVGVLPSIYRREKNIPH